MLWRRYHEKEETPRKTKGREKEDETNWTGRNTPGGVSFSLEGERIDGREKDTKIKHPGKNLGVC
jgi:hypothetical protein